MQDSEEMKLIDSQNIGIGVLAGIIAAAIGYLCINLLYVSPYLSIILGCFISLPIFIAAFGWGTKYSLIAVISAMVALMLLLNAYVAFGFFLLFFAPAFYAAWLLGFAQADESGKVTKWFPLSSVFFMLATFIAMICVFIGIIFQNNPDTPIIAEQMANMLVTTLQQAETAPNIDLNVFREKITTNIVPLISIGLATYSTIFLIGNLYFSVIVAQKMQRLARPKDDWPSSLYLPFNALIVFAAAFLLSFFQTNSIVDLIALVFNTVFTLAFSIAGLAYLHNITRKIKGRVFILSFVYIALFTLVFALPTSIVLLLMGIWATIQYSRKKSGS